MIALGARYICTIWLLTAHLSLFAYTSWGAEIPMPKSETIAPMSFKNVDEAIGWVKAKGDCKTMLGKNKKDSHCKLRLELPDEKQDEGKQERVWQVWAWMDAFDFEFIRTFRVSIVRSRVVRLSPNESKTSVRSVRVSTYEFGKSGKVSEVYVESYLENFNDEKLLRLKIPISPRSMYLHTDGGEDVSLLHQRLGVGWNYLPE